MERNVDFNQISDGKKYGINDMVKADCNGCNGCHQCCSGMGSSIILDPYDVYMLCKGMQLSFEQLLERYLELNVADGVILPNLKMTGEKEECVFLNDAKRCTIHTIRPGICRIFPLGRIYENGSFSYFLQVNECAKKDRLKVKVKKWIDCEEVSKNQQFISDWHYLFKEISQKALNASDEILMKKLSMDMLKLFYLTPYDTNREFYEQFYEREKAYRLTLT